MTARVTEDVMRGLKDFQRTTVDHVFDRLHAPGASGRFLVADEVGLGKTLVARGVIAKTIDYLREKGIPRIDIVYICSNGEIARQNINRLKVGNEEHIPLVSRLTLLPRELPRLKATKSGVNFISFTPGTSFDLKSGLGQAEERVLLSWLLRETWKLGSGRAPINVLQGNSGAEPFRRKIECFDNESLHDESRIGFAAALERQRLLRAGGRAGRSPGTLRRAVRSLQPYRPFDLRGDVARAQPVRRRAPSHPRGELRERARARISSFSTSFSALVTFSKATTTQVASLGSFLRIPKSECPALPRTLTRCTPRRTTRRRGSLS